VRKALDSSVVILVNSVDDILKKGSQKCVKVAATIFFPP
jgi:hypothetical protein